MATLKPIHQQVIFITGATSGIGLATVREAVAEGAKVFMIARNEEELQRIQDEMRTYQFETAYAAADVAEFDQLQAAADKCLATFGRIDTWINNAGITIFGKFLDTTEEEARRLFDTNFWGVVNGCKVAIPLMREHRGSIINVGSILARTADPLQIIYTAAEHAIKGFTDALKKELRCEKLPVEISLVLTGAVDTPFLEHARSKLGEVMPEGPLATPEEVAQVLLKCAVRPQKEVSVGVFSRVVPIMQYFRSANLPARWVPGSLFSVTGREGEVRGHVRKRKPLILFRRLRKA